MASDPSGSEGDQVGSFRRRCMLWGEAAKRGVRGQDIRVELRSEIIGVDVRESKEMAQGQLVLARENTSRGKEHTMDSLS